MDKCIFCGWHHKNDDATLKFFGIPKEPGLKRVQWLQAIGDRMITPRDKVCARHFRQGRPSNDPSHEDFVPHLHLQPVIIKGVTTTLTYLEKLADEVIDGKDEEEQFSSRPTIASELTRICTPSILRRRKRSDTRNQESASVPGETQQQPTESVSGDQPQEPEPSNVSYSEEPVMKQQRLGTEPYTVQMGGMERQLKFQRIPRSFAEAVGLKAGQLVMIKRRIRILKNSLQNMVPVTLNID